MSQILKNSLFGEITLLHNTLIFLTPSFEVNFTFSYRQVFRNSISGKSARPVINDDEWVVKKFIPDVQQRGAAIINARGSSSAASAANAAIEHIRDWVHGTNGQWTSMGIPSDGSYGIDRNIVYSYPVICKNGRYEIVQGLAIDKFSQERMEATRKELLEERDGVQDLLN